jgi:hypothetical protein
MLWPTYIDVLDHRSIEQLILLPIAHRLPIWQNDVGHPGKHILRVFGVPVRGSRFRPTGSDALFCLKTPQICVRFAWNESIGSIRSAAAKWLRIFTLPCASRICRGMRRSLVSLSVNDD